MQDSVNGVVTSSTSKQIKKGHGLFEAIQSHVTWRGALF